MTKDAPKLLVSVRNVEEAEAALAGGADWIDLKEPRRGALGAVDASVAKEVVARVAARAPLSAAAGELGEWAIAPSRGLLEVDGVSVLKLGLAGYRGRPWQEPWNAARREIEAAGKELVAVIYADDVAASSPDATEILQVASAIGCRWVLIDTFDKSAGSLLDCRSANELQLLLQSAHDSNCTIVTAGRLDLASIAQLPLPLVNIVGVRGAACVGGRNGTICSRRVAALRAAITGEVIPYAQMGHFSRG